MSSLFSAPHSVIFPVLTEEVFERRCLICMFIKFKEAKLNIYKSELCVFGEVCVKASNS